MITIIIIMLYDRKSVEYSFSYPCEYLPILRFDSYPESPTICKHNGMFLSNARLLGVVLPNYIMLDLLTLDLTLVHHKRSMPGRVKRVLQDRDVLLTNYTLVPVLPLPQFCNCIILPIKSSGDEVIVFGVRLLVRC